MRSELPVIPAAEREPVAQSRFGEKHEEVVAGAIKQISAMDAKSLSDMREALLSHIEKAELDIRKNASGKEVKKAEKSLDKNQRKLDALNIRLKELGVEVESRESVPPESGERLTLVPDDGLEEVEASAPPEEDPFLFNLERQALPRLLEMQNELKEEIKRSSEDLGTAREEKNKSRINQLLKERGRQFDRLTKVEVQMAHLGIGPIAESLQESGLRYTDPTEAQIDDQWPEEPPTNPMRVKTPVPSIESDLTVANANTSDEHLAARLAARESSTPSGRRTARTAAGFRAQASARKSAAATASAEPSRSKAAEKPRNVAADQFPKDVPMGDFNLLPERLRRRYELKPGETTDDLPALQAKHQEERYRALSELRAPKREKTKAEPPRPTPKGDADKKAEMDQESGRDASLDRFPDDISDEDISQLPEHLRRRYELKPGESINDLPSLQAKHQEERLRALSELRAPVRQEASTDAEALPIPLVRKKGTEALRKDIQTWYTRRIEIAEDPKHADERKELDQKITKAEALLDQKMYESKAAEAEAEAARIKQEMADAQARFEAGVEQANIEREREIQERKELEELEDRRRKLEKEYRNAAPTAWPGITKKMNEVTREIDRKQTNLDLLDASVTDLEREAATHMDEKHALFERYEDVSKRWDVLGLALAALALKLEGLKDVSLGVKTSADKKRLSSDEAADVKAMRTAPPSDFRKDFGDLARRTGRIGGKMAKWTALVGMLASWGLTRPFRVIGNFLQNMYELTMDPKKFMSKVSSRFSKEMEGDEKVKGSLKGVKWLLVGDPPKKKEEKPH